MARVDITHRYRLRVIYAQTDRMNIVYYSRYYEFFEAARSALLRRINAPYAALERDGYRLPVVESYCRYHGSATFEDLLTVETYLEEEPKVKFKLAYKVFKAGREDPIVTGYTVHSFVNSDLRPVRAPGEFIECLRRHAGQVLEDETPP